MLEVVLNEAKVEASALEKAKNQAKENSKSVLRILEETGVVSSEHAVEILARHFGMAPIFLSKLTLSKQVTALLSADVARRYKVIPVAQAEHAVHIAVADPMDLDVLDNIGYILKSPVEPFLAAESDLMNAINKYYGVAEDTMDNMLGELSDKTVSFLDLSPGAQEDAADENSAPVVKLVSLLIAEAFQQRASDIHIEPLVKRLRVRYRVDGVLHEVTGPPKRLQGAVISRLKIMANLSIAEKRLPQDGRIKIQISGKSIDLRVSCLPSTHGESVVMRILDKSGLVLGLSECGFLPDQQKNFENLITLPNGIILITGPTGSGKTTTLYTCLNFINRSDRKIITVEDPCEYQLAGINQVQVNEKINLTFANVLRSILRQAPNVIMVGEIRDVETAEIAINAALTGHLVFSTLHTNDAAGAVTRLIDQGVKPFLVASSVQGILAQRLVRKICKNCKTARAATPYEVKCMGVMAHKEELQVYFGAGCDECKGKGYRGRLAIIELLVMTDELRAMINQKATSTMIKRRARELGMRTLREDGINKVLMGLTSLEEVIRMAGETEK